MYWRLGNVYKSITYTYYILTTIKEKIKSEKVGVDQRRGRVAVPEVVVQAPDQSQEVLEVSFVS